METKPWYTSKTILGAIATLVFTILDGLGVSVSSEEVSQIIYKIGEIAGITVAIWGRIVATKTIRPGGGMNSLIVLPFILMLTACAGLQFPQFQQPVANYTDSEGNHYGCSIVSDSMSICKVVKILDNGSRIEVDIPMVTKKIPSALEPLPNGQENIPLNVVPPSEGGE